MAGNGKTFKTNIMILLGKMHSHVWNTFILSAILLSSCCPPPVDDEVYINIYQNMSIETIPVENVIDTCYRRSPEFFFANSAIFDKEPRGKFLLHAHGYVCEADSGNMLATLAEVALAHGDGAERGSGSHRLRLINCKG